MQNNERENFCQNPEAASIFGGCVSRERDQFISRFAFICDHERCPVRERLIQTSYFSIINPNGAADDSM